MGFSRASSDSQTLRRMVAREAAFLIYTSQEKEYKQAKIRAAETLGVRILPSNREIAEELDAIATELEGRERLKRIVRMRREALEIMQCLKAFNPRLIGSVWRGTIHKNSDIDIIVYSASPEIVLQRLRRKHFIISEVKEVQVHKDGNKRSLLHIFISLPSGDEVEIVVREVEEKNTIERCEIYGDIIKGLNINQLKNILQRDPYMKFVPE